MNNYSYWEKSLYFKVFDIIIIGAGITGLINGILAHKRFPKKKILILEKNLIGTVATTKNAGFACIGSPSEIIDDIKNYGLSATLENVENRFKGLETLFSIVSKKEISYKAQQGSEVFDFKTDLAFKESVDNMEEINKSMEKITKVKDIYSIKDDLLSVYGLNKKFNHLISIKGEGQLHSGQLSFSLERRNINQGNIILKGVEVLSYEKQTTHFEVSTNLGVFKTAELIICTNSLLNNLYNKEIVQPGRGLVLVSTPLKKAQLKGSFHYNQGYTYFRGVENRILLGGGRNLDKGTENTHNNGENEEIKDYLIDFLHQIAPNESNLKPEYFWSGIMGFTENKKAIVKIGENGEILCAGMNGMGIAISSQCAKEAVQLLNK